MSILFLLLAVWGCEATAPDDPEGGKAGFPAYAWPAGSPAGAGMDTVLLDSAVAVMKARSFVSSLLIVRGDSLILEYYRSPYTKENDFDIRSATKSVVSVLVGIALDEGLLQDIDRAFLDLFPEYRADGQDPRKDSITFRHLLTMRGGFDHQDGGKNSDVIAQSDDWVRAYIGLPLQFTPGEYFSYSSLQTHMLSATLSRVSGLPTEEFLARRLFDPLRITLRYWDKDPKGINTGGNGMFLTPRDMARFGHLMLRGGAVDGRRLVSRSWIDSSFVPRNLTTAVWSDLQRVNYGYQWWLNTGPQLRLRFAAGYGGQFIVLDPDRDLVIVTTADTPADPSAASLQEALLLSMITRFVIRAAS